VPCDDVGSWIPWMAGNLSVLSWCMVIKMRYFYIGIDVRNPEDPG